MKATGIVRPVDPLGRVVIPVELRRNLGIKTEDSLEVFVRRIYNAEKIRAGMRILRKCKRRGFNSREKRLQNMH